MWRGKEYWLRWIWFMLLTLLCKQSPEIFGQYNNYTCVWLCVCVRMCWLQWKHCLQKDIQTLCCGNDISWCIVEWCWLYRNDLVQSWKIRQRSMLLSFWWSNMLIFAGVVCGSTSGAHDLIRHIEKWGQGQAPTAKEVCWKIEILRESNKLSL